MNRSGRVNVRRAIFIVLFAGSLIFAGACSDDPEPEFVEIYHGRLTANRISLAEKRTDSVSLLFEADRYGFEHFTSFTGLCSSHGTHYGQGTSTITFTPTGYTFQNCDSTRIPSGEFRAIFRNDSLILMRDADSLTKDIEYEILLKKTS